MAAVRDFNTLNDFKVALSVSNPQELRVFLTDEGRQLYFQKECLEPVSVSDKLPFGNGEAESNTVKVLI